MRPIHLHARDRQWIVRKSPHIQLWQGESLTLMPSVTLLRLGGHFPGGSVLHWDEGDGMILAGDIIQVTPVRMACRLCGATRICCRCQPLR